MLGVGGGTASYFAYNKLKNVDLPVPEEELPNYGSTPGPFRSNLPLGKVLASWTTNYEPSVKWDDNWDRRDPESLLKPRKKNAEEKSEKDLANEIEKLKPKATRHLFFVRHGQYEMDVPSKDLKILTALGREQAEFTGLRFQTLNFPYDKIINSTMPRAKETSDIIAKNFPEVPRQATDLLQEGAPIPPEPPLGSWQPEKHFFEDGARIEAAFRKFVHRADPEQKSDSYEIYVCHANVIRYFVCRALQLPPEAWLRISLYNGSITHLVVRPSGRVAIKALGDAGFMPPEKMTTT